MNARALAARAHERLRAAGVEDARFEAEYLVRSVGGISRAAYFAGATIDPTLLPAIEEAISRRERREPAAYITGEREFYGLSFAIGPGVLVPRPETELLVDLGLRPHPPAPSPDFAGEGGSSARTVVVDVGTGSGAIAVALAAQAECTAEVIAIDVSRDALAFARLNARRHGSPVRFILGNLLEPIRYADVVLANLPYIPSYEIDALEPEVSRWEPRVALDGGGDGFVLIRRLVADCAARVRPRLLALEVGYGQADEVRGICDAANAVTEVVKDLSGIDRVVCARWA